MGVSDSSETDDSDGYAMAGNGFGLRTTKTSDAQAAGSAHEGCTYDALSDGNYGAECVCSSTASAATDTAFNYDGVSG
jgi:hypothetical protein